MSTLFWVCVAVVVALCVLSAWDWYRMLRREKPTYEPETFRMVDQERAASIRKLAEWQRPAKKGVSEESTRARLEAATKIGDSR